MTTLGVDTPVKVWRIDVDEHENFWMVSDDPASDNWDVRMTCKITRNVKTDAPVKGFVGLYGGRRRNAWPLTPFSEYGYIDVVITPEDGEPFVAMKGHLC